MCMMLREGGQSLIEGADQLTTWAISAFALGQIGGQVPWTQFSRRILVALLGSLLAGAILAAPPMLWQIMAEQERDKTRDAAMQHQLKRHKQRYKEFKDRTRKEMNRLQSQIRENRWRFLRDRN